MAVAAARRVPRPAALVAHTAAAAALALVYLAGVFQLFDAKFWTAGLGDWIDPYFINALLEHWAHSAAGWRDPASPPMYFPAHGTLGYSHGLVLYALFYVPIRLFAHPFQAYSLTLLAVMTTGTVCLYFLLHAVGRVTRLEAAFLTAFFATSGNVINGSTAVWSQRASVFLVPPILLLLAGAHGMRAGPARLAGGWACGLFVALLYTQDFYTAHFAAFFAALMLAAALMARARPPVHVRLLQLWTRAPGALARLALVVAAVGAAWTCWVWMYGGGEILARGIRIRSHDWRRPAAVASIGILAYAILHRRVPRLRWPADRWPLAVVSGAIVGLLIFAAIYLPAYREHPAFPEEHLLNALTVYDTGRWRGPLDVLRLSPYETWRPFVLALVAAVLAWLPGRRTDATARTYGAWIAIVSPIVLLMPVLLDGFSIWRAFFAKLPGFDAIRDPKRVVYLYELALVLAVAALAVRWPAASPRRIALAAAVLGLLAVDRRPAVFDFARPNQVFDRWVAAPVAVDPACSSFYVARASAEYSSRSDHKWTLYGVDALFVAMRHDVPTLNGYSAWFPTDWDLFDPADVDYYERVARWVGRHKLTGICALDMDRRVMRPVASMAH